MAAPVISVAQMREWERVTWASGQNEDVVMRQAGRAVGQLAERLAGSSGLILALAGKGHNGDDAAYAAEYLRDAGANVEIVRIDIPETSLAACEAALQRRPVIVIDGLFGIGLNRVLDRPWQRLIQRLNQARTRILAVDVPSGLNAQTGVPMPEAVRATWTLTLGAVKQGLLQATAWPYVGRLLVAPDIGLVPYPFTTDLNYVSPDEFREFPPPRSISGHKGTYGHLSIVAGSLGYHGAAVLAARGAQRARPGLVTVLTSPSVYVPVASQLQAAMVRPWNNELALPDNCTAVLVGPGLAGSDVPEELKASVRRLWQHGLLPVIADATALEWLPEGPCPPNALRVITPHPGEAAHLLQSSAAEVQKERAQALRSLSSRFGGCRVILKGHQTLVGRVKEPIYVNCSGNPWLAQGGSGDLLAGFLAGHLAQPELQGLAAKTTTCSVWRHGAAADRLQEKLPGWTIEDLAQHLGG